MTLNFPSSLIRTRTTAKRLQTLFLSKKMLPVALEEPVNVVLSPAFYWFREVVLPAKNAIQAKKLAPAYFDSVIPEGEYEFMAIAQEESYWLFAYDPAAIAEAISDAGLRASQVHAIYFAQTECDRIDAPVQINSETVLVANEGHVGTVASNYAVGGESIDAYLNARARSRHKVPISLYRSGWLSDKQLNHLTLVAVAIVIVYLANYLQLRTQYELQLVKEQTLKSHYKLPETSFQLKSLMRSLEGRKERQLKLRNLFRQITLLPLSKTEAVSVLALDTKKADFQVLLDGPKREEAVKAAIEKFARIVSSSTKDNTFYVSIAYE